MPDTSATASLEARAWRGLAQFILAMAALLFLPAWTLSWWQAWLFLAVFAASVTAITAWFLKADPALVERRLQVGPGAEKEPTQRIVQGFAGATFIAFFLLPSLDHRFGWSSLPVAVNLIGDVLVALGLFGIFFVFRENSFTSGVVEIDTGQHVVSTGPYAIVRHPMYVAALLMLLGIPLALGSVWALLLWPVMTVIIVIRLLDEERFLAANLAGYRDYQTAVRWRLLPGIF